ncbi:hypothetical protein Spa11_00290 [Botrimarina mediterranea]|uniref:Uncharacterized protein n=2 Tax=Botrimarina mediterranea TaxID=2528022 RepID=A0A518K272_9BACT|nr:hypothetical protein Spa11_00290 [Botrimarina mediterranea]
MGEAVHHDALSAWRHLCALGGLELEGRDEGIDERILTRLDPRASSLEQALANADMASFVRAFFESLHPYVAMFRDILAFFQNAKATRGKSQWSLRVDDIEVSLEHFRDWLANWDFLSRSSVTLPAIDANAVWRLLGVMQSRKIIQEATTAPEKAPYVIPEDARQWAEAYTRGSYLPWPSSLGPQQCHPALATCAKIGQAVLQRLLDQQLSPPLLKALYNKQHQEAQCRGGRRDVDPSDAFDLWTIAQYETDFWLRSIVASLSVASRLPNREIVAIGDELDAITDPFPTRQFQVDVHIGDLESVLSLPIWEKRYDLYAVWIATEIIRALKGHDVEIHHDDGLIAFNFKEATVATVHSSPGPFKLICERQAPLTNPRGKGRIANVQPDHGLWTTVHEHEVCKMVIEVKHYKKSSKGKFIDVFEDYALALPDSVVYLVNHGPAGNALQEVSATIRNRCRAIGHLTPSNSLAREELATAVRQCVGEPISRWPDVTNPSSQSNALLIDVSGSMATTLRSESMRLLVRFLAEQEMPAKLVAADSKIVGTWDIGEAGFEELLLSGGGATHLDKSVKELLDYYESVFLITDQEGVATLRSSKLTPHVAQSAAPDGIVVRICQKQ